MYLEDVEITNPITKIETINANTNIFMNNNNNNTKGGSYENEFNDILNQTVTNSGDPNPMMKTVYVEKKPNIHSNNPITIVTSFFLIEKSKHTFEQYYKWISNFLNRVKCPIVIFTNMQHHISQQLNNGQQFKIINSSLSDLYVYKKYYRTYKKHYGVHSSELYVIWSSKVYFMNRISNILNPFNSTYFFWIDIDSFRNRLQSILILNSLWPDYNRVLHAFSGCQPDDNCLILGLINDFDSEKKYNISQNAYKKICPVFTDTDHVQGGFIVGTSQSIHWFYEEYFTVHDAFIREDMVIGKEVLNAVILKNSQHHILLLNTSVAKQYSWNKWFYFQLYFATNTGTNVTGKPKYLNNINKKLSKLTSYYKSIPQCKNVLDTGEYHIYSAPNDYKFSMCLRENGYLSNIIKEAEKWRDCDILPFIFEHVIKFASNNKYYNNETINYFLDVGSNIGACSFTMSVQAHLKNLKIISFEPLQSNQFYFTNTMLTNNFTNINLIKCGVSNEGNLVQKKIFIPMSNPGAATIEYKNGISEVFLSEKNESVYTEEICVTTIDHVINETLKQHQNTNIIIPLMKLDIEGFEYFALQGAKHLLTNDSLAPWVIKFEYTPWHIKRKGLNLIDLFKLMENYHYDVYSKFLIKKSKKCFLCPFHNLVDVHSRIANENYVNRKPVWWGMDLYAVRRSIFNT